MAEFLPRTQEQGAGWPGPTGLKELSTKLRLWRASVGWTWNVI